MTEKKRSLRGRPRGARNKPKPLTVAGAPVLGDMLVQRLEQIVQRRIDQQIEAIATVLTPKTLEAVDNVIRAWRLEPTDALRTQFLMTMCEELALEGDDLALRITQRLAAMWREQLALIHIDDALNQGAKG